MATQDAIVKVMNAYVALMYPRNDTMEPSEDDLDLCRAILKHPQVKEEHDRRLNR